MQRLRNFKPFSGDKVLWTILLVLGVISILVVYSSSAKMGYNPYDKTTATGYLTDQFVRVIVCMLLLVGLHQLPCRLYNRLAPLIYWGFVGLTLLAYAMGAINGASRWFAGMQPSEGLKVATVIMMARQLAARQSYIDRLRIVPSLNPRKWFTDPVQRRIWREGTIPVLGPMLVACAVIVKAHSSSAMLVFIISMVMMYVGRVKRTELLKVLGLMVVAASLFIALGLGRSGVATGRVSTWVKSWVEPQQKGTPLLQLSDTDKALIAIQKGGLVGRGAGHSAMRVDIMHPESDYIYALFVEEYGLFLALILMIFYLWISVRGIAIFTHCETAFPGLLVLGSVLLITIQAMMHIMVSLNLFPETGQNLPFVSHGGSSLLFSTIAMAMVLGVSRQNEEKSHVKPRGESILEKR